ncbi:MAG: cytochrome c oxidase subunit I, partial [Chloroflexi bacterium]|nr:cytochrome c oxidase subunit I [Chloroflexota bacterium]
MSANYQVSVSEKKFIGWHILIAAIALSIGSLFGPLQAFEHAGWDLYPYLEPLFKSYYQGLTLHGVLNALVWTTFFI